MKNIFLRYHRAKILWSLWSQRKEFRNYISHNMPQEVLCIQIKQQNVYKVKRHCCAGCSQKSGWYTIIEVQAQIELTVKLWVWLNHCLAGNYNAWVWYKNARDSGFIVNPHYWTIKHGIYNNFNVQILAVPCLQTRIGLPTCLLCYYEVTFLKQSTNTLACRIPSRRNHECPCRCKSVNTL